MSIRITLAGAQITELVSAMEAQLDYYCDELANIERNRDLRTPEEQAIVEARRGELTQWRDACQQVLDKVARAGYRKSPDRGVSVPLAQVRDRWPTEGDAGH